MRWILAAPGILLWLVTAGQGQIHSFTVTPSTLSFVATDPDNGGPAPQSSVAGVLFRGSPSRYWTLHVQAESGSLNNCGGIPASALVLRCLSARFSGAGPGNASCNASPVQLSTAPQLVAQGRQGTLLNRLTVEMQVSFVDSWRYPGAQAHACTVSLRYIVDIP
jgi:hypothetical protein